jgi:ABC-type multidrug transport system ATPase subunit
MFGVADYGSKSIARYSRGMKRRLALARALICDPQLLLLDDPLLGLDPDGQRESAATLRGMGGDRAILISSHDLNSVEGVCDRIVALNQTIHYDGPLTEFRSLGDSMFSAYTAVFRKNPS